MTICAELEDLIPIYVLDALDEADCARVQSHLHACPKCERLGAEYRQVADLLPYAAQQVEPRAELKYRVLAATTSVRRAPLRRRVRGEIGPAPSFVSRFSELFSALLHSPVFSAAALVLVVGLGIWNLALQNQLAQQGAEAQQIAGELRAQREVLTLIAYSDGQPRRLQGTEVAARAVGRIYGTSDQATFAMVTYDLPKLPTDKVYQLWLIDASGSRTSGGTFTVDEHGRGWLFAQAPKVLGQYKAVGVTVEPLGGSPGPTGAKMLGGDL
ncbi:MAG: anti-sigma factor [Chloroflexi bacterium]|nr:anti-sigma factor [Chloroflexota bacterium]